jgi:hypothetical protein
LVLIFFPANKEPPHFCGVLRGKVIILIDLMGHFLEKPHMSFYVLGIKILTIRLLRSNTSQPS